MSCTGKTGQELKDCQAAAKKAKGFKEGDGLKGTVADLNAANFKNRDVMKWTTPKASTPRPTGSSSLRGLAQLGRTTRITRLGAKPKKA